MATLEDLYSYEAQIEPAFAAILIQRGVNAFIEFSDATKDTPYTDISIVHVAPTGHTHIAVDEGAGPAAERILYYDAWHARLFARTYTQRGKNSDEQAAIMGIIRAAAAQFQTLLIRSVLPLHAIEKFSEAEDTALARGYDHATNLDWSEIRFDLVFSIRSDVW